MWNRKQYKTLDKDDSEDETTGLLENPSDVFQDSKLRINPPPLPNTCIYSSHTYVLPPKPSAPPESPKLVLSESKLVSNKEREDRIMTLLTLIETTRVSFQVKDDTESEENFIKRQIEGMKNLDIWEEELFRLTC